MTTPHLRCLWRCGLLACIALLVSKPAPAEEPPSLDWYPSQIAPVFILTGNARNQGFGDVLLRALIARLPHYRHHRVDAPLERVLDRMSSGSRGLACAPALLYTPERATRMVFSNAYLLAPPNGAVIRASDGSRFEPFLDAGRLSLSRLLQTRTFVIGIERGRSYDAPINALLAAHAGQARLIEKSGRRVLDVLLSNLVRQQGIDVMLAYPLEAAYWIKTSRNPIPLRFLPIAEALEPAEYRMACSRTPEGEQVIAAINAVLADPAFGQEYLPAYAHWQAQLASVLPGMPFSPRPTATP